MKKGIDSHMERKKWGRDDQKESGSIAHGAGEHLEKYALVVLVGEETQGLQLSQLFRREGLFSDPSGHLRVVLRSVIKQTSLAG